MIDSNAISLKLLYFEKRLNIGRIINIFACISIYFVARKQPENLSGYVQCLNSIHKGHSAEQTYNFYTQVKHFMYSITGMGGVTPLCVYTIFYNC